MYRVALMLIVVLLVSCIRKYPARDENCDPQAFQPVYIGVPDYCCEQNNFGWIKIENTSNDTFYRYNGLGAWIYYPGRITKETYFNSVSQKPIEIYRNKYYNGNIVSYSSMIYSAPDEPIICDTIFVNL